MTALATRTPAGLDPSVWVGASGHPDWCERGHHCGLGEHRAQPVRLEVSGAGSVVLTRVLSGPGRQHAEVRISITLAPGEFNARAHLAHILNALEDLLEVATIPT